MIKAPSSGSRRRAVPKCRPVAWKTSWCDDCLKYICGFANAHGGVLEVGRNNRGRLVEVTDVLRLLEEIPQQVQSLLGIDVDVNLKSEQDTEYLEIVVSPCPCTISFKGDFHYRSQSIRDVAQGAMLNWFWARKYGRTWDAVPMPGMGLKDLDSRAIETFRRLGAASKRWPKEIAAESEAGVVKKLGLSLGGHLKRAAVLLFHSAPERIMSGAYIEMRRFRGAELLFEDVIKGNLFTQVDRTVDLLRTKYTRTPETLSVPVDAVREAVVNAVVHRDYAVSAPIRISVYDHRIVLWNPGRLPEGQQPDELTRIHPSSPSNPVVANAFFQVELIEVWGGGIPLITKACKAAGSPAPQWRNEPDDGVQLELPFVATAQETAQETRETTQETPGAAQETAQEVAPTTQETTPTAIAPTTRERILALLKAEPRITRRLMAERIGITPSGVKYHLTKLRKAGIIRHVGPTKAGRWEVLK